MSIATSACASGPALPQTREREREQLSVIEQPDQNAVRVDRDLAQSRDPHQLLHLADAAREGDVAIQWRRISEATGRAAACRVRCDSRSRLARHVRGSAEVHATRDDRGPVDGSPSCHCVHHGPI